MKQHSLVEMNDWDFEGEKYEDKKRNKRWMMTLWLSCSREGRETEINFLGVTGRTNRKSVYLGKKLIFR